MISLWITALLAQPSIALPVLFCFGGIVIMVTVFYAFKYFTLPAFKKYVEKETHESGSEY
jgi:hypothetical protein